MHRGYITDLHRKSVTFAKEHCALSAAANASQISVVYTIDCISYVFLFICFLFSLYNILSISAIRESHTAPKLSVTTVPFLQWLLT